MISIDINKLTGAEVDLIEDTLNEKLGPRLGDRIVTFSDVLAELTALSPEAPEPRGVRIPMGKLMRTLELVQMRRTNPSASWDDTGQANLIPQVETAAPADPPSWPTPAPAEPSALPA